MELQKYTGNNGVITKFTGMKLSRYDKFTNPYENRDLILRILNNYRFSRYFINEAGPNVLIIFNDREYVCTIKEFVTNDERHKYSDRLYKNGFYKWIMKDSYTVGEIIRYRDIKDFIRNRITIDISQNFFDRLSDQYTYDITIGLLTHRIYSTPPEKVYDPYQDTIGDSLKRALRKLFD
jgi:hypothetical protein